MCFVLAQQICRIFVTSLVVAGAVFGAILLLQVSKHVAGPFIFESLLFRRSCIVPRIAIVQVKSLCHRVSPQCKRFLLVHFGLQFIVGGLPERSFLMWQHISTNSPHRTTTSGHNYITSHHITSQQIQPHITWQPITLPHQTSRQKHRNYLISPRNKPRDIIPHHSTTHHITMTKRNGRRLLRTKSRGAEQWLVPLHTFYRQFFRGLLL